MKILVVGSGGREHALLRALRGDKLNSNEHELHVLPGNAGMQHEAKIHAIEATDLNAIVKLCAHEKFALIVVGPEVPLAMGLADRLRALKFLVFGPSAEGAKLEASKIYSKEFLHAAKVPTARAFTVSTVAATLTHAREFQGPPYVLKADGLAAGKGVVIAKSLEELKSAATDFFERRTLGEAGAQALLEEFSAGYEISYLVLTNGHEYETLALAQDHKRLHDGDHGPNTGGMGTIAPVAISSQLETQIREQILLPTMREMQARQMLYRGVLYVGLMITAHGPSVIEFNVRFGDPEAQVILPLLDESSQDWAAVLVQVAQGDSLPKLKWKNCASVCVVMAAPGYPDSPQKNVVIEGDVFAETAHSYFLHAGTTVNSAREWITNGGRVLNSVGVAATHTQAIAHAYAQARHAHWPQQQMRTDIGSKI